MIDWIGLTTIGAAFFIVAASPGPATLAVATVAMRSGRRAGLIFGAGLALGLAFWGLVAATGLGAILQASSIGLTALKVVGGAYLLWLALGSARSARDPSGMAPKSSDGQGFLRGLLLNLSNPKAVLAWMATLALGLGEGAGLWQVGAATGLCMALGLAIYAAYALAFSTRGAMAAYGKLRRGIDGVVAGLFAIAGLALLRSAVSRG